MVKGSVRLSNVAAAGRRAKNPRRCLKREEKS
jgi:hypothetical protein